MQQFGKSIPGAFWWLAIPILIGAITPVIAQFYPTNEVFWSALVVAIGGAVIAAIKVYVEMQAAAAPKAPFPTREEMPAADISPGSGQRGAFSRWFLG